ncbi:MAG: nuclear transport factor 2 family protein [Pseudonocardiaceae bacterium]|nr:nuclear transport factor 2 family protein [Pseudonocardiaceae bacterium]
MHRTSIAFPHEFAAAFNTGDLEAVQRLYEPGGIFVASPGQPDTPAGNRRILDLGQPVEVTPRHVHETGDLALLIVDWTIAELRGTATDVARRGPDGRWRYVIDNPFGTGSP